MPDLFQAGARGDVAAVKAILARGADPNCRNFLSMTPLMLAAGAGQQGVVDTLLASGAQLDAESPYGTALTFAAMSNQGAVARALLAKGANPNPSRGDHLTIVTLASVNGDTELAKLVLARLPLVNAKDADGATALMAAARFGHVETAKLLLSRCATVDAADSHRWTALLFASANGQAEMAKLLLSRGANPNSRDSQGRTPLLLAASYSGDAATLKALIDKGADVRARDSKGRTALDILAWRGNQPLVAMLKGRGAPTGGRDLRPPTAAEAIGRGLSLIEHSTAAFQKATVCSSCHHQGLGLMATGLAKERGFRIDSAVETATIDRACRDFEAATPLLQKAVEVPELAKMVPSAEIGDLTPGVGFALAGVAAHGKATDPALAAIAVILGRQQFPDGHWQFGFPRVPIQSSFFTMTALAVRAVRAYAPDAQSSEVAERLSRAKSWLLSAPARTSEDRASRLLGLKWTGASPAEREKAVAEVLADQRADGGWAQLPELRSDAYATGLTLCALAQGGDLPATHEAYRRGVAFLLRTQDEDGSWFVNKRAMPANNYMDAGFPHGESQFISFGATAWATMALMLATDPPTQHAAGDRTE